MCNHLPKARILIIQRSSHQWTVCFCMRSQWILISLMILEVIGQWDISISTIIYGINNFWHCKHTEWLNNLSRHVPDHFSINRNHTWQRNLLTYDIQHDFEVNCTRFPTISIEKWKPDRSCSSRSSYLNDMESTRHRLMKKPLYRVSSTENSQFQLIETLILHDEMDKTQCFRCFLPKVIGKRILNDFSSHIMGENLFKGLCFKDNGARRWSRWAWKHDTARRRSSSRPLSLLAWKILLCRWMQPNYY